MPRWCYVALFNQETSGFLLDSTQVGNYLVRRCYTFNVIFHYRIPGGLNSDTIAQKKTSIADIFSSVLPTLKNLLLECDEVNITIENIVASPPGVNSVFFRIPVVLTASDSVADSGVSSTLISCLDKLREYKALLDQRIPTINQGGSTYSKYNSSTMTDKKSCCGGNIPPPCCATGSVKVSSTKCGKQWSNAEISLRSKRFRLVSEQRNTEEGDFRYGPREKWNESPLPALLLAPLFSRSLTSLTLVPHSFRLNRTETLATQAMQKSLSLIYVLRSSPSATVVKPQSHIQLWSSSKLLGRLLVCRSFSFFSPFLGQCWTSVCARNCSVICQGTLEILSNDNGGGTENEKKQ